MIFNPDVIAQTPVATILRVDGMTCSGCTSHIERALIAQPSVICVSVDVAKSTVGVEYDSSAIELVKLIEVVQSIGYVVDTR